MRRPFKVILSSRSLSHPLVAGSLLLLVCTIGCTRSDPAASLSRARPAPAVRKSVAKDLPRPSQVDANATPVPPTFAWVGVTWVGPTGFFAIRDPEIGASVWHKIGDRIGNYEIVAYAEGALVVRAQAVEFRLQLSGIELPKDRGGVPSANTASFSAASGEDATIKVWSGGIAVEAAPSKMPANLLAAYTESKEAMLKARVSADVEPMIAQALESSTVIVATGPDGIKRSDFPPEVAAKLNDDTLAKINADVKSHEPALSNESARK